MKKVFFKFASFAAIVAAVSVATVSCDNDDNDGNNGGNDADSVEWYGEISEDTTLDASKSYTITGPITVEDGATLTIPAGMTIKAQPKFSAYLLVLKGGMIKAEGTADAPIVFESTTDEAWGGLVINGKAKISGNETSGSNSASTEISTNYSYGGDDDSDNSGTLKYVILRNTGNKSSGSVEHNGLTLNGVGSGTTIENIFIDGTEDDGIEFFGGCVNVKNLLVVNSDDDMFDFTQGYRGTLTNCYGVWESDFYSGEKDPRGIEADGNFDGEYPDSNDQSNFKVVNMTIQNDAKDTSVKNAADGAANTMYAVIKLRRYAKASITNALVTGTNSSVLTLLDLADGSGGAAAGSVISITNKLTSGVETEVKYGKDYRINTTDGEAYSESDYTLDINPATANTGCDSSIFSWTGYQF